MQKNRSIWNLEALLVEGLKADQCLEEQLKALKEAHQKQMRETERRQHEDLENLEKRILRDSLLSVGKEGTCDQSKALDLMFNHKSRVKRSSSTSDLAPAQGSSPGAPPPRPSPAWVSSTVPSSRAPQKGARPSQQLSHGDPDEEAACQKRFRALPLPSHVGLPLYHEVMQLRERKRMENLRQRKDFLLSIQKPFSFLEREREKRARLTTTLSQVTQNQNNTTTTAMVEVAFTEGKRVSRVPRVAKAPDENDTQTSSPKLRCSQRTRKEMLAFLDEKPTFKPKISPQVPDFRRQHKALQKEAMRTAERREATTCEPFHLRTSALPSRQSRRGPAEPQEPKVHNSVRKSRSSGCLSSLSRNTLPTYITDATRTRGIAIRKTSELRDSQKAESEDWMRGFQTRSRAMQKTVSIRAKVTDPHSSLKEVHPEKLQRHRDADHQLAKEYTKELREMQARVTLRPYLFEQVKQKHAKVRAEQTYRRKLQEAGLNEGFVEANGIDGGEETKPRTRAVERTLESGKKT